MFNEPHPGVTEPEAISPLPQYITLEITKVTEPTEMENPSITAVSDLDNCCKSSKIFLAKPNAKALLAAAGRNFLKVSSTKHSLELHLSNGSFGNVLTISGKLDNQQAFQKELQIYLSQHDLSNEQIANINNVPNMTKKAIKYIRKQLQLLTRSYGKVADMYRRYQYYEQFGVNQKSCEKIRRSLNIVLFGQFGLRDGRQHVDQLISFLKHLKTSKELRLSAAIRNKINAHIVYIFTSYNHHNYEKVIFEYEGLGKKDKILRNIAKELHIAEFSAADESSDFSTFLHLDDELPNVVQTRANVIPTMDICPNEGNDLLLNVSGQMIDPIRVEQHDHEAFKYSTPISPRKTYKTTRVHMLINDCREMVTALNYPGIACKFDKICNAMQYGELTKASYRALNRMYMKLLRKTQHKERPES